MTKETLVAILGRTPGVEGKKNKFDVAEGHEVTFYLGRPGQAMQVGGVDQCLLDDVFVELRTREGKAVVFAAYDDITVVAARPPRDGTTRRAGF
jgi:hypothetical protein